MAFIWVPDLSEVCYCGIIAFLSECFYLGSGAPAELAAPTTSLEALLWFTDVWLIYKKSDRLMKSEHLPS